MDYEKKEFLNSSCDKLNKRIKRAPARQFYAKEENFGNIHK